MYFSLPELSAEQRNKLLHSTIVPRPIAWIVTRNPSGAVNVAPFSFFNVLAGDPPILCVCIGSRQGRLKDTALNIAATGEFVVNLVSASQARRMNVTAIEFPQEVDEAAEAGLQLVDCHSVGVPRIEDSPASYECRTRQSIDIDGRRSLVIADIVGAYITDKAIVDREAMHFDPIPMDLIARLHNPGWYCQVKDPFQLVTPSVDRWEAIKQTDPALASLRAPVGDGDRA